MQTPVGALAVLQPSFWKMRDKAGAIKGNVRNGMVSILPEKNTYILSGHL